MEPWEDFSAFGDIAELEHVCDMLKEDASVPPEYRGDPAYLTGWRSHLVKRLRLQDEAMERLLEQERPGLYPRTWMADLHIKLFQRLDSVTQQPEALAAELPAIVVALHKVLIAAHDVYDGYHRERLIAAAEEAERKGERQAHRVMGKKGGEARKSSVGIELAVKERPDKTAQQIWDFLSTKSEEEPYSVEGFRVFLDESDARLKSKGQDGEQDGRGVTRHSFGGVVTRVRAAMKKP